MAGPTSIRLKFNSKLLVQLLVEIFNWSHGPSGDQIHHMIKMAKVAKKAHQKKGPTALLQVAKLSEIQAVPANRSYAPAKEDFERRVPLLQVIRSYSVQFLKWSNRESLGPIRGQLYPIYSKSQSSLLLC